MTARKNAENELESGYHGWIKEVEADLQRDELSLRGKPHERIRSKKQ